MKFWKFFLVTLVMVIASCGNDTAQVADTGGTGTKASPAAAPSVEKYRVKSGIVEYAMGAAGIEMKKMYFFDDHGKKERMEIYYENQLSEVQFTDGENHYSFRAASDENIVWNHGKAGRGISPVISTERMKNSDGVTIHPDITHLGITCESYTAESRGMTVRFAGYKGVQMLMESSGRMTTYDKAIKADFNVAVPAEKFKPPAGYEITPI
jgi:hypothetical protein